MNCNNYHRNRSCNAISSFTQHFHRDVKPENMFVDRNWIVRIGEFNYRLFSDTSDVAFDKEMSILTSTHIRDLM
jgi:serine/threonine protein kinase